LKSWGFVFYNLFII